jgi:hypothetical protein
VIHHICTKFVFFAFGNLDRTLNNEVYDFIDIQVLVYYAPPAPTIIRVSSLCFSLNTGLGEMFFPTLHKKFVFFLWTNWIKSFYE